MTTQQQQQRPDLMRIRTLATNIWLADDQMFYETPKTYELWQEEPILRYVRRWNKSRVCCEMRICGHTGKNIEVIGTT